MEPPKVPTKTHVHVLEGDTFTVAQSILRRSNLLGPQDDSISNLTPAKVAVLNMASEKHPGGGWLSGALAQEEALCFRSTLASTLKDEYYPLQSLSAIYSHAVAVFRSELAEDCQMYEDDQRFVVGVVSVAGLRHPKLTQDKTDYGRLLRYCKFKT